MEEAYKDLIEEYVGFEIDWDNPPGPAAIALDAMQKQFENTGVQSESISDLSVTYMNGLDPKVLAGLQTIRKLKW